MKLLSIVRVLFEEVSRRNRSLIKEDVNYDDVVADLFKIEPELASIGSREQYIEYLKGVFPNSKFKDVVYRGSSLKYDMPNDPTIGIYLTIDKRYAKQYGDNVTLAIIDTSSPLYVSDSPNYYWKKINDVKDRLSSYDAVVYNKGEEIVISSKRVHMLGSKQDIDGFKKYVK